MLIKTSYRDVVTNAEGRAGSMRIYIIEPNVPEYPNAKFPGCGFPCFLPSHGDPWCLRTQLLSQFVS